MAGWGTSLKECIGGKNGRIDMDRVFDCKSLRTYTCVWGKKPPYPYHNNGKGFNIINIRG